MKNNETVTGSIDHTEIRLPLGALTPLEDAARFNATFSWEVRPGLPRHIQDLVGTVVNDKPVLPEGANVPGTVTWQLDAGWAQNVSDGIITFGFFDGNHAVGLNNSPKYGEGKGYSPFTEAQKTAARDAIHNWDDLIAAKFVEVKQGPGVSTWVRSPEHAGRWRRMDRRSAHQLFEQSVPARAIRSANAQP